MHEHDWKPVRGDRGVYACECGALGRRDLRSGQIVFAKRPRTVEWTIQPKTFGGGRIDPKRQGRYGGPDADEPAFSLAEAD